MLAVGDGKIVGRCGAAGRALQRPSVIQRCRLCGASAAQVVAEQPEPDREAGMSRLVAGFLYDHLIRQGVDLFTDSMARAARPVRRRAGPGYGSLAERCAPGFYSAWPMGAMDPWPRIPSGNQSADTRCGRPPVCCCLITRRSPKSTWRKTGADTAGSSVLGTGALVAAHEHPSGHRGAGWYRERWPKRWAARCGCMKWGAAAWPPRDFSSTWISRKWNTPLGDAGDGAGSGNLRRYAHADVRRWHQRIARGVA